MFRKRGKETTIKEVVERNTGLSEKEYFNPVEDPYIKGIKEAALFIKEHADEKITIVGDYDCDGICAATIMYMGIIRRLLPAQEPEVRIPRRFSEGYGLSEKIIDEINEGLVITVDNGIASIDAIRKAKEKGLKVIITDHHLPVRDDDGNIILPPADVIIDPWTEVESEYRGYCGAGLAYRLIKEMIPDQYINDLKTLAAIATVADVMTITETNWLLVRDGIRLINEGESIPAINKLMGVKNIEGHVNETTFGFDFGPIGNAPGRLLDEGAQNVFTVFTTPSSNNLLPKRVSWLLDINEKRKDMVKIALNNLKQCKFTSFDKKNPHNAPIIVYNPTWGEGIIGLVAGDLCERYQCPAIAFTKAKNGLLKGSGRSVDGIHLKDALDRCKGFLEGYGGHAGAAGMSIKPDNLPAFAEAFKKACGTIPPIQESLYDLDLKDIEGTLDELKKYAPFGEGNPRPCFRVPFNISEVQRIGKDKSHLKVRGQKLDLIGFNLWDKYSKEGMPKKIEAIGYLGENWFNGEARPTLELVDFCSR